MTFSLLARDSRSGALGGVSATGNLCVGGWVLRGEARSGMTASQGLAPSTLWGEDALAAMASGASPGAAVNQVTGADGGRDSRQLAALGADGQSAVFDGAGNHPFTGHLRGQDWVVAGNWLGGREVIERAAEAFEAASDAFEDRLLAALRAGVAAGSDRRGTLSAALLVLARDRPPLSLRVDYDPAPLDRLGELLARTREPAYSEWLATLPTREDPERA